MRLKPIFDYHKNYEKNIITAPLNSCVYIYYNYVISNTTYLLCEISFDSVQQKPNPVLPIKFRKSAIIAPPIESYSPNSNQHHYT